MTKNKLEHDAIDSLMKDIRLIQGYAGAALIANEAGKEIKLYLNTPQ